MATADVMNVALERGDEFTVSEHMVILSSDGLGLGLAVRDPDSAEALARGLLEAAANVRAALVCVSCGKKAAVTTSFGPYCARCVYSQETA